MLNVLKKLIGADEESKQRRKMALEAERREREQRVQERKQALEETVEAEKEQSKD